MAIGALLTTGSCSSLANFFGVFTFLVFAVATLMDGESGLEMTLGLAGILDCEDHGDTTVSFTLSSFGL